MKVPQIGLLQQSMRGPSFETAAARPPQDEVVVWHSVKVSAYERATPVAHRLSIKQPMSATGVARSQQ
jgi:hypothetical protein